MLENIYDIHTHILPGVDDGSKSFDESMEILKKEYGAGVRTIYATSHYRLGMFEPKLETVKERYKILCESAKKSFPNLKIILGCEFHACENMVSILDDELRPTLGNSGCVLVEFSSIHNYDYIRNKCYELLVGNYTPIIAHIERYPALFNHFDLIEELIGMGAYTQMNANTILGKDGFKYKMFAKKMMKNDLVHFIASDVHNTRERTTHIGECIEYVTNKMGQSYADKIFCYNPENIINR